MPGDQRRVERLALGGLPALALSINDKDACVRVGEWQISKEVNTNVGLWSTGNRKWQQFTLRKTTWDFRNGAD